MLRLGLLLLLQLLSIPTIAFAEVRGDFDGDGITDLNVRRDLNDRYYWWVRKSGGGVSVTQWGFDSQDVTDISVLGDYDGDGKTDIAVWRTQFVFPGVQTYFWILRSSDNTAQVEA